jgi:3-hydroxyisobutyrate dehydrogenase
VRRHEDFDMEPEPPGALDRLGFIGTGNLGSRIVANLLRAGFEVTVHDARSEAAASCLRAGATWAPSPAAAAATADTVLTCLPKIAIVAEVVTGEDGVLAGLRAGGCWVDVSTNDADELCRLADLAAVKGVDTLEAPVTGGVHKAAAGELTVLVGGRPEVFTTQRRLLQAVGSRVIYLGPLGQASRMKVITNMLAFVHLVAAGEAMMLAARAGIDLKDAFEAIKASSGNSFVHETESQVILSGTYDIGFTLDLACKDLGLVRRLAADLEVPTELADLVERRFVRARQRYGAEAWSPRVVQLLEDQVGTVLRSPGFPDSLVDDPPLGRRQHAREPGHGGDP